MYLVKQSRLKLTSLALELRETTIAATCLRLRILPRKQS